MGRGEEDQGWGKWQRQRCKCSGNKAKEREETENKIIERRRDSEEDGIGREKQRCKVRRWNSSTDAKKGRRQMRREMG
jgi:hypothetical protein